MRTYTLLLCLALPFALLGCEDDATETAPASPADASETDTASNTADTTGNNADACVPWEGTPAGQPESVDAGEGACELGPGVEARTPELIDKQDCEFTESLAGTALIVNALVLQEPSITFLLDALNPIWANDIGTGNLVILFNILSHDLETGLIEVEAAGTPPYRRSDDSAPNRR